MTVVEAITDHPATFTPAVLDRIGRILVAELADRGPQQVLDPFAGVGTIHELAQEGITTVGLELQPEWAACHPDTVTGDATALPFADGEFTAAATSPCYGNRMKDSHQAQDRCKAPGCEEGLIERPATPEEVDAGHELGVAYDKCKACRGTGMSWRNTYTHVLRAHGAEPVKAETNASTIGWGAKYRAVHEQAVNELCRVVDEAGLLIVNMSNHLVTETRGAPPVEQRVVEWWVNLLLLKGCRLDEVRRVKTPRNGYGANGQARVDGEVIIVARNRSPRWR